MASLPIVPTEGTGLARYLDEIRRFPMLEQGEEYMLAKRWREHARATRLTSSPPPICGSWPRSPWAIAVMVCRFRK